MKFCLTWKGCRLVPQAQPSDEPVPWGGPGEGGVGKETWGGWNQICFPDLFFSLIPVHVREFTIWCVWRGVGMRVGHPRLVQPDQRELFQIFYFYNGRGRLYNQGWF